MATGLEQFIQMYQPRDFDEVLSNLMYKGALTRQAMRGPKQAGTMQILDAIDKRLGPGMGNVFLRGISEGKPLLKSEAEKGLVAFRDVRDAGAGQELPSAPGVGELPPPAQQAPDQQGAPSAQGAPQQELDINRFQRMPHPSLWHSDTQHLSNHFIPLRIGNRWHVKDPATGTIMDVDPKQKDAAVYDQTPKSELERIDRQRNQIDNFFRFFDEFAPLASDLYTTSGELSRDVRRRAERLGLPTRNRADLEKAAKVRLLQTIGAEDLNAALTRSIDQRAVERNLDLMTMRGASPSQVNAAYRTLKEALLKAEGQNIFRSHAGGLMPANEAARKRENEFIDSHLRQHLPKTGEVRRPGSGTISQKGYDEWYQRQIQRGLSPEYIEREFKKFGVDIKD